MKKPNLSVFHFRPKRFLFHLNIKTFSIYIIFGNLLRIIPIQGLQSHVVITEYFVYFFALLAIPFLKNIFSVRMLTVCALIAISSLWGACLHGFDIPSSLYALRLILIIISGLALGQILFILIGPCFKSFTQYFCSIYFKNLLLGCGLLLLFPNSVYLWQFLASFSIGFDGDPHSFRLVSTYFDPNFYGAIGCIPFLVCYSAYKNSFRLKDFLLLCFFAVGILLTWSRSGITTFAILLISLFFINYWKQKLFRLNKTKVLLFFIVMFLLFGVCVVYSEQFLYFINRFIGMKQDSSAQQRFDSFSIGFSLFKNHWLFGTGYNYLFMDLSNQGLQILHSSLVVALDSFGIVLTSILILILFMWFIQVVRSLVLFSLNNAGFYLVAQLSIVYLMVCFCFSSNFNNLLFFPFWLLPIIMIFSYLSCYIEHVSKNILVDYEFGDII